MGVQVGAYGTLDKKTGEFLVEGNIYDAEIQKELDKQDIDLKMADFQPVEAAIEDSLAIAAQVSENGGLNAEVTACVLASLCMIVLACRVAGHIPMNTTGPSPALPPRLSRASGSSNMASVVRS